GPRRWRGGIARAAPAVLCQTGEVEIEPGIVDQDDEVERFLSENLSDRKNPTGQGADRGRPDDPDHVQVAEALHQLHAGSLHAWAAHAQNPKLGGLGSQGGGEIGAVQIARSFTRDDENAW